MHPVERMKTLMIVGKRILEKETRHMHRVVLELLLSKK